MRRALVGICLASMLLLTACAGIYLAIDRNGFLYFFECTKGQTTHYNLYSFLGTLLDSDDLPPEQGCLDAEDDVLYTHGVLVLPPPAASKSAIATSGLRYMLDVSNYYAIQVFDPSTKKFTEVDLPGPNASYPVSADMMPDGSAIWVLQYGIPQNTQGITPRPPLISIFDTASQTFTGSFNLPDGISADTIRFTPDGTTAYVSNSGSPFQNSSGVPSKSSVLVLDVASKMVKQTITTPKGAGPEVMSPDGLMLYTFSNQLGGNTTLSAIDTTTNTVGATVNFVNGALKMFINPTGTRLYIYDFQGILVYDTATLQQISSIPTVGFSLRNNFAAFSPSGQTAWFCNCGYGAYYQVDLRTNQILKTVQGSNLGHGYMIQVDGN